MFPTHKQTEEANEGGDTCLFQV